MKNQYFKFEKEVLGKSQLRKLNIIVKAITILHKFILKYQ